MANKEPIKHHYIPQFILRNFCYDDRGHLLYFDKKASKTFVRKTTEVFMVRNLYRDDINNPDHPTKIEKDMARFECEVAPIITERFLNMNKMSITFEEDEKLKLFFAIMAFRSKITRDKFGIEASNESKTLYSIYQKNGDLSDLWKRNLGNLVNCRSMKEVLYHKGIDDPIKMFFLRDTFGCSGLYFIIAERSGPKDFIISDVYPTDINGVTDTGVTLPLYSIFSLSPDRILLLASNGVEAAPKNVAIFSDIVLRKPTLNSDKKSITIRVRKISEHEVQYVNSVLLKETYEGFSFKSQSRVTLPI